MVLACTNREVGGSEVLEAGLERALSDSAHLVIYDAASLGPGGAFPGAWTEDLVLDPTSALSAEELDVLGHHEVADKVRDALSTGVDVRAVLVPDPGPDALAEFALLSSPDLVLLGPDLAEHAAALRAVGVPVDVVS